MKNKPQDFLKQLMENPENLSVDKMDLLVKKSLEFFKEYMEISKNGDEKEQEKALNELLNFKDELQKITQETIEKTGFSQDELLEAMNNKENFSEEQWKTMKNINESITEFNTSLMAELLPKVRKNNKSKKQNKNNYLSV